MQDGLIARIELGVVDGAIVGVGVNEEPKRIVEAVSKAHRVVRVCKLIHRHDQREWDRQQKDEESAIDEIFCKSKFEGRRRKSRWASRMRIAGVIQGVDKYDCQWNRYPDRQGCDWIELSTTVRKRGEVPVPDQRTHGLGKLE